MERCPKCGHISVSYDMTLKKYRCLMTNCIWESKNEPKKVKSNLRKDSKFNFSIEKYIQGNP